MKKYILILFTLPLMVSSCCRHKPRIEVVERAELSPKTAVSILRIDTNEYVISETPSGVALMDKLTKPTVPENTL